MFNEIRSKSGYHPVKVLPRRSNPPQWTVFASRRQGFTPTLRLVQNPANGRQAPQSACSKPPYFAANRPVLRGIWGLTLQSGTKKEPKPKLLSPDIFRWGRGLPHEGVGAKKFGMPLETREIKFFWRDIPGFCRDIPGVPEKFEKKSLGSIFVPYTK